MNINNNSKKKKGKQENTRRNLISSSYLQLNISVKTALSAEAHQ
jgi:hypothetical protein